MTEGSIESLDSSWNKHQIRSTTNTWNLYTHPDLEITVHENASFKLILLGYLLDPFEPDSGNSEILNRLAIWKEFDTIVEATHMLNGRFLLFYISKEIFRIINDASGFRQLFFLKRDGLIHCGSTLDILKEYLGVTSDPEKEALEFLSSEEYRINSFTWVGYDTVYLEIKKLPPNYLLDIYGQTTSRFWPVELKKERDINKVAVKCGDYLKGCFLSSLNRKPIHLGVTGGWDSRVLIAATRNIRDHVFYYINRMPDMGDNHMDISISEKLAGAMGYELNILNINESEVDDQFIQIHKKNNFRANDILLPVLYFGHKNNYDDTFTVSGSLAEGNARKYYYMPTFMTKINGRKLSRIVRFKSNKYAIRKLNDWLEEVLPLCNELGIDVLDLYQIEQEACNWCSFTSSEQDIVREEMRPFNSRYLISQFWSLDTKYRLLHDPIIYFRMINYLWAETLDLPVNPSLKSKVTRFLISMGIGLPFYRMKSRINYTFRLN